MSGDGRRGANADPKSIVERFGASVDITGPDPDADGFFFVKRPATVDHDAFVTGLLGVIGATDRLVVHHRSGFAIVRISHGLAGRLRTFSWIDAVGAVQFDPTQFAAVTGAPVE